MKVCRQSQVAMLRVAGLMATVATLGGKLAGTRIRSPGVPKAASVMDLESAFVDQARHPSGAEQRQKVEPGHYVRLGWL
jgi:hypothetical protein